MKEIIVSTIFKVCNYGTVLQAYATQNVLEKLDCNVKLLNYQPNRIKMKRILLSSNKDKKTLKNKIYRIISILYRSPSNIIIKIIFNNFIKKNIVLTKKKYTSNDDIKNNIPEANIYITGSDQVWNSNYNEGIDKTYFLDFVSENKKKISYAASIGMEDFREEEKDEIKKLLSSYSSIGVRELSAKQAIEKLNLNAKLVLDPTSLLEKDEWRNFSSKKIISKEKYLLLYILGRDKNLIKYAKKIAKEKNLKIIKVGLDFIYFNKIYKNIQYATPKTFLNLLLNSDYIVTNSFHGISFAINLNKQFIAIPPKTYSTRLESLLNIFNLKERMVNYDNKCILKDIDYKIVNKKLNELRKESIDFLKGAIEI